MKIEKKKIRSKNKQTSAQNKCHQNSTSQTKRQKSLFFSPNQPQRTRMNLYSQHPMFVQRCFIFLQKDFSLFYSFFFKHFTESMFEWFNDRMYCCVAVGSPSQGEIRSERETEKKKRLKTFLRANKL